MTLVRFFLARHLWRNLHDLEDVLLAWDHCRGGFVVLNDLFQNAHKGDHPSLTLHHDPKLGWGRSHHPWTSEYYITWFRNSGWYDYIWETIRLQLLSWYCQQRLTLTTSNQEDWMRPSWESRLSSLIFRNKLAQDKLRAWRWLWNRSQRWTTASSLVATWMTQRLRQRYGFFSGIWHKFGNYNTHLGGELCYGCNPRPTLKTWWEVWFGSAL